MGGGAEETAASRMIQKQYEEPLQRLTFNPDKEFLTELHRRINEYFKSTGRPQKGGWQVYLKAAIILACFFATYVILVFFAQNIWLGLVFAILLALLITAIGFNIQHDGGHRAFSQASLGEPSGGNDDGYGRSQLLCLASEARHSSS